MSDNDNMTAAECLLAFLLVVWFTLLDSPVALCLLGLVALALIHGCTDLLPADEKGTHPVESHQPRHTLTDVHAAHLTNAGGA